MNNINLIDSYQSVPVAAAYIVTVMHWLLYSQLISNTIRFVALFLRETKSGISEIGGVN